MSSVMLLTRPETSITRNKTRPLPPLAARTMPTLPYKPSAVSKPVATVPVAQHDQGDAQARSGADAQDKRPGQRVAEHGLHLQAAQGQGGASQRCRGRLGQPELHDDGRPGPVGWLGAGQDLHDVAQRDFDGA